MAATQVNRPGRATIRTAFAATVAVLTLIPVVLATAGLSSTVVGAQVIVVTGAVTRVLALPGVEAFLQTYVPWLAAEPGA